MHYLWCLQTLDIYQPKFVFTACCSNSGSKWLFMSQNALCYNRSQQEVVSYFTGSQDSRSKPLWMDWAMEDSIRSTYRTTSGAYRSCKCLWNFPLHRWSTIERERVKSRPFPLKTCNSFPCSYTASATMHLIV